MIGYMEDLYEDLEELDLPETDDPAEARFQAYDAEEVLCNFFIALTDADSNMDSCLPFAIFNELWGWYCGGTENGVYQYFEQINEEYREATAEALRKYGCEKLAEQYINAGKELIPLLNEDPCNSDLINETSNRYGDYIDDHALEICMAMRKFLLDKKEEICAVLDGGDIFAADDKVKD